MTDISAAVAKYYRQLKAIQEPRGYFFNNDREWCNGIIEGLLTNMERYGYMACPCRLASGDQEEDRDIICPCRYREQDVEEYGSCYCSLYVSLAWNEGRAPHVYVPERRSP